MQLTAIKLVLIVLGVSLVNAQTGAINCEFSFDEPHNDYICFLRNITLTDDENQTITIGGDHLPERDEFSVNSVIIEDSTTPFIINQIFTTFPYVDRLLIESSGLQRIQPNAFANATFLHRVYIYGAPEFRHLPANAFEGASSIQELEIVNTGLETFHDQAFSVNGALFMLSLGRNNISALSPNLLRPLESLGMFYAFVNHLESLDGRLFQANNYMRLIDFGRNQINSVGRNFFDNLRDLEVFAIDDNICADDHWYIGGEVTIDTVIEALETCFANFVDDVKIFTMELRGTLIIRDQNGTEITRLTG